jgi:hypothetical protein
MPARKSSTDCFISSGESGASTPTCGTPEGRCAITPRPVIPAARSTASNSKTRLINLKTAKALGLTVDRAALCCARAQAAIPPQQPKSLQMKSRRLTSPPGNKTDKRSNLKSTGRRRRYQGG